MFTKVTLTTTSCHAVWWGRHVDSMRSGCRAQVCGLHPWEYFVFRQMRFRSFETHEAFVGYELIFCADSRCLMSNQQRSQSHSALSVPSYHGTDQGVFLNLAELLIAWLRNSSGRCIRFDMNIMWFAQGDNSICKTDPLFCLKQGWTLLDLSLCIYSKS